jgi:hypothetical protein
MPRSSAHGTFRKCRLRRVKAALGSTADSSKPPEGALMSRHCPRRASWSGLPRRALRTSRTRCLSSTAGVLYHPAARFGLRNQRARSSRPNRLKPPGVAAGADSALSESAECLRRSPICKRHASLRRSVTKCSRSSERHIKRGIAGSTSSGEPPCT